jgi:membrane protein insertase Oxa1/YidC/SpoIIIJ
MMELYKEREVNPFSSIGILIVQIPILIGLYASIRRIINDPHQIISFSYPFLHHFSWMQMLSADIHKFDNSLFGLVNLTRTASGPTGIYWPAMIIVLASAVAQYLQSKQLMPSGKDSRSLRQIMREAGYQPQHGCIHTSDCSAGFAPLGGCPAALLASQQHDGVFTAGPCIRAGRD